MPYNLKNKRLNQNLNFFLEPFAMKVINLEHIFGFGGGYITNKLIDN